jgi:DNA-binding NarL/FixJ family response regulator
MDIRLLLIDEHRPSREILARRLASFPDMEVVGSTAESEEGLRQIKELHPDLVLLDIKMKKADGMEVCRRACAADGAPRVAILTSYIDPEERRMAYQAGASGYFLKEADTPKLARWIRLVSQAEREARQGASGPEA